MTIIGLTGGIGSGKTYVSSIFKEKGITCVDADDVAREIVFPGQPTLAKIAERYAEKPDILTADGQLNRALLRSIIFNNPNEKQWLENLMHPVIRDRLVVLLNQSASPYSLLVSPLLFETDQKDLVHRSAVVDIPEDLQVERASQRDNVSKEQIKQIMQAQLTREQRLALADDIIDNSIDKKETNQQVQKLHEAYLKLKPTSN